MALQDTGVPTVMTSHHSYQSYNRNRERSRMSDSPPGIGNSYINDLRRQRGWPKESSPVKPFRGGLLLAFLVSFWHRRLLSLGLIKSPLGSQPLTRLSLADSAVTIGEHSGSGHKENSQVIAILEEEHRNLELGEFIGNP